jgi:chromosome segregation ATPase
MSSFEMEVLSFPSKRTAPTSDRPAALDLVYQAADAIRANEERVAEIEQRAEALARRMIEQVEQAEERVKSMYAELCAAEDRAKTAETQAHEAKAALAAVEDAIRNQLLAKVYGHPSKARSAA